MAFMEISIVPIGTAQTSLSQYVAHLFRLVKESGLNFQLHDMGTTVQGDIDDLFLLASRMHKALFDYGIQRIYTVIKIDDRRDKKSLLGEKTDAVMEKL